jgi:hypothetical protein
MPRSIKLDDEIALLEKRRDEAEKKLKAAQERRKKYEQQQEDRRKVALGTIVLNFMRSNPDDVLTVRLNELLAGELAPSDRPLFPALSPPQRLTE